MKRLKAILLDHDLVVPEFVLPAQLLPERTVGSPELSLLRGVRSPICLNIAAAVPQERAICIGMRTTGCRRTIARIPSRS